MDYFAVLLDGVEGLRLRSMEISEAADVFCEVEIRGQRRSLVAGRENQFGFCRGGSRTAPTHETQAILFFSM